MECKSQAVQVVSARHCWIDQQSLDRELAQVTRAQRRINEIDVADDAIVFLLSSAPCSSLHRKRSSSQKGFVAERLASPTILLLL